MRPSTVVDRTDNLRVIAAHVEHDPRAAAVVNLVVRDADVIATLRGDDAVLTWVIHIIAKIRRTRGKWGECRGRRLLDKHVRSCDSMEARWGGGTRGRRVRIPKVRKKQHSASNKKL